MNETQIRLIRVLLQARQHYGTDVFIYQWEINGQTILFNDKMAHMHFDIYFQFGEKDLDVLVKQGYLMKGKKTEDEFEIKITYSIIRHSFDAIPHPGA